MHQVADLNKNPKLPYDDNQFDFVTNVVSVDYLVRPTEARRPRSQREVL